MKNRTYLKIQLISFIIVLTQGISIACSCAPYEPTFCRAVHGWRHIITAVVVGHSEPHLMEVNIIENLNHTIAEDTISILGQDGWNCGADVMQFEIADTVIMAIYNVSPADEPVCWYVEGLCGLHYLRYENGKVVGQITESMTEQDYQSFKDNLLECVDMDVSTTEAESESSLEIYPNPVNENLYVFSKKSILNVSVFDMNGRKLAPAIDFSVNELSVNVEGLDQGIYFIQVETGDGVLVRRFLKGE